MIAPQPSPERQVHDLDSTEELPVLNVAAYEAQIAASEAMTALDATSRDLVALSLPSDDATAANPEQAATTATIPDPDALSGVEHWIAQKTTELRALQDSFARARYEQERAESRAESLAIELSEATSTLTLLDARVKGLEGALASEQATAQRVDSERVAARLEVERVVAELATLNAAGAQQHAALIASTALLDERSTKLSALERTNAELQAERDRLAVTGADLETQLASTQTRERELQKSIESKDVLHGDLSGRLAEEARDHAQLRQEFTAITAELMRCREQLQSRESYRAIYETNLHELDTELHAAVTQAVALEAQAADLNTSIAALNADIAAQRKQIAGLESTSATQAEQLSARDHSLEEANREHARLGADLEGRGRSFNVISKELDQERRMHAAALASHAAQSDEQRKGRLGLEEKLAELGQQHSGAQTRLAALEASLGTATQLAETHAAGIARAQERTRELETTIATQESQAAAAAAELSQGRTALAELIATAHSQHELLAEQGRQLCEGQDAARLMADSHSEQMQLVSALREQIDGLNERLLTPESERRALEDRAATLAHDLAVSNARTIRLEATNADLRSALEQQRQALTDREAELQRVSRVASSSTYALGRVQSSIDDLGSLSNSPAESAAEGEQVPVSVLTRIDSDLNQSFVLRSRATIGRDSDNDIQIDARFVSRHHAAMVPGHRSALVEDLSSTNGVVVNGRRVRCARLTHGDVLTFGTAKFRYTVASAPDSAPSTVPNSRNRKYQ